MQRSIHFIPSKKGRERETHTDRQTDRQTDRPTDRQTDMITPHPTYLRSQRKQEYGSNNNFSQFSRKNYILLSVGTPDLSDTSLVAEVPRNPAPLRRWMGR